MSSDHDQNADWDVITGPFPKDFLFQESVIPAGKTKPLFTLVQIGPMHR
jgi:hypothetical protein